MLLFTKQWSELFFGDSKKSVIIFPANKSVFSSSLLRLLLRFRCVLVDPLFIPGYIPIQNRKCHGFQLTPSHNTLKCHFTCGFGRQPTIMVLVAQFFLQDMVHWFSRAVRIVHNLTHLPSEVPIDERSESTTSAMNIRLRLNPFIQNK